MMILADEQQLELMQMTSKQYLAVLVLAISGSATATNVLAQGKTTIVTTVEGQVSNVTIIDNPPPARAFNTFTETDADQNGKVDRTEAHEAGVLAFSTADLNNDGWLDKQEYKAVADGTTRLPPVEEAMEEPMEKPVEKLVE